MDTFPLHSINTWDNLSKRFLNKYFPPKRIVRLWDKITTFSQLDSKCIYEAWERYKGLLRQCPQYNLPKWLQVQYFNTRLNLTRRANFDSTRLEELRRSFNYLNDHNSWLYNLSLVSSVATGSQRCCWRQL